MTGYGERALCCTDSCSVTMVATSGRMRIACHTSSRISSLCADPDFKVIVVATIDGMIHVFNALTGALVRSCSLGGEPRKMLITPVWGFILVLIRNVVTILNVNGLVLKEFDMKQVIVNWFAFAWYNDFDYIVFVTEAGRVGIFEAFHPEESREFHEVREQISNIHLDRESGSLLILAQNGTINVLPHPKID